MTSRALTKAEGVVILLFVFYTFAGAAIGWKIIGPWIVHAMSFLLIAAALVRVAIVGVSRVSVIVAAIGLFLVIYAFSFLDTPAALYAGSWFGVCAAYLALFHRQTVRSDIILWVAVITHVLFIIWIVLGLAEADRGVPFNKLTLIPTPENYFSINIGMPGSTKHFSATLSGMLLLWSVHRCLERGPKPLFVALTLWGAYLTLFSGSRAVYLGVAFGLAALLINRQKLNKIASLLLVSLGVATVFALPLAMMEMQIAMPGTIGALLKTVEENPDLTAGRAWLWSYHIDAFLANPMGGGQTALADFEVLARMGQLPASGESFFTGLLAIYGIVATAFFLAYLGGYVIALRNRDLEMVSLMMFVIVTTASSSLFDHVYASLSPVVLALVACRWTRCQTGPGQVRSRQTKRP